MGIVLVYFCDRVMKTEKDGANDGRITVYYIKRKPELMNMAAEWFHSKWGVTTEAYLECMEAYLKQETELDWFLCLDGDQIVGGLGVIEKEAGHATQGQTTLEQTRQVCG